MSILFSPHKISSIAIKNRFVSSATVECLVSDDNRITAKYLKVYERLSKNSVGLIIPGNYFVTKSGVAVPNNLVIDHDGVIGDLRRLTTLVHENGSRIVAQLNHGGRQCDPKVIGQTPLCPSAIPDRLVGIRPQKMTSSEIWEIIEAFGAAAARVQKAGFDGVQINGGHGYLVNQFLSAHTNRRKDEWGGSLEKQMKFLIEVYNTMRNYVGTEFPILVKINAEDHIKNGVTPAESVALSKKLDALGIDAIEVSGGIKETGFTTTKGDVPKELLLQDLAFYKRLLFGFLEKKLQEAAQFEEGYHLHQAAAIKKEVNVPVIVVGGLRSRGMMEKILEAGQADFVALSRPFIRQPNLVARFEKDPIYDGITCPNCNRCVVEITMNHKPLRCYYTVPKNKPPKTNVRKARQPVAAGPRQ